MLTLLLLWPATLKYEHMCSLGELVHARGTLHVGGTSPRPETMRADLMSRLRPAIGRLPVVVPPLAVPLASSGGRRPSTKKKKKKKKKKKRKKQKKRRSTPRTCAGRVGTPANSRLSFFFSLRNLLLTCVFYLNTWLRKSFFASLLRVRFALPQPPSRCLPLEKHNAPRCQPRPPPRPRLLPSPRD